MTRSSALVALTALVAVAGCSIDGPGSPGSPAPPVELRGVDLREPTVVSAPDVRAAAARYLLDRRASLGLTAHDDLVFLRAHKDPEGRDHVRLQQVFRGITVFGADVVAHVQGDTVLGVGGNLAQNLDGLDTAPTLDAAAALARAKSEYAGGDKDTTGLAFDREKTELVVLPSDQRGARLAWHVVFHTELQRGIRPGLWNTFVDAQTGVVLLRFNAIHALSEASGPGGNAKAPFTWTDALDVEPSGAQFAMDTTRLKTVDMRHSTSGSGTTVVGPLSSIGDAAINDAHGYAEVTVNFLTEWFGYNSIDGQGFKILSRVHYGTNYENAFWDGSQMTYGDGASMFYPLSGAVDVVAHEINHGFTSFHSDLTYSGQSGGMNEAFSDIAGTIGEWYVRPATANFDVGETVFKAQNEALRYMCDPKKDGASIDNAADYTSSLDVHYSSGVYNKAFCLSAKRLAGGGPSGNATQASVKRAGQAFYRANANYWTASSTFVQGCKGVLDAAAALGFSATEVSALQDSFADVGVACGPSGPNQAPTATLTSPVNGSTVAGTITVSAAAADSDGTVAKVSFVLPDGTVLEDATSPYSVTFDTTHVADGPGRVVTARATDNLGAVSAASTVTVTVQNQGGTGCVAGRFMGSGVPLPIPDNDPTGISSSANVTGSGTTASVKVSAEITHTWRGDLKVTLSAPDGTSAVVFDRTGSSEDNLSLVDVDVPSLVGKTGAGSWRLLVQDLAGVDVGTLDGWSVALTGSCGGGGGGGGGHWSASASPNLALVDNGQACTSLTVTGEGNAADVKLDLSGTHAWRSILKATLAHGGVTQPAFATGTFPTNAGTFALTSRAIGGFTGSASGAWTLCVIDTDAYGDTGTLATFGLHD